MLKSNFKYYTLADLITIYSFLNDFSNYKSFYNAIVDVEDEILNRFADIVQREERRKL